MAAVLVAMNAGAQTLSKEITVDKDVVPQEREATRLVVTPKLVLPAIQQKTLAWTDRGVVAEVEPSVALLSPAPYASSIAPSPYRGYIMAGYFPTFQLGVSAGYKLVKSRHSDLNAWLQYDGSSVKRTAPFASDKITYNTQDVRIGVEGKHTFEGIGTLEGSANYGYSSFNFPTLFAKGETQGVNRGGIELGWESSLGEFDYSIDLGYDYFGFSKSFSEEPEIKADKNNTFELGLKGKYGLNDYWSVGASIDYATTKFSSATELMLTGVVEPEYLGRVSYSMTDIHPYVQWKGEELLVKAGLGVQVAAGDMGKSRLRPDVRVNWTPSSSFALWAQLNDRRAEMGTKAERYDRNRYINPNQIAGPEWDKWRVEGGFIVGPFSGASIEAWAGAAKMSTWFAPTVYLSTSDYFDNNVADIYMGTGAEVEDFSDVHYGIAVNYDYRDVASLRVSWEGAPQEFNKGYAEALDRAKSVFAASVGVHPVKPLDITLSYSVRSGRSTYSITPDESSSAFQPYVYNRLSLGNAASLDLGATYRFTERFNVWAHVENILNKKWQQVYGIPNKGVTGLVGVAYRF
jgi:hypothetical protein